MYGSKACCLAAGMVVLVAFGGCKSQKPPPQAKAQVRAVALPRGQKHDGALFMKVNGLMAEIDAARQEADDLAARAEKETDPAAGAALLQKAAQRRADQRVKQRELNELLS